MSAPLISIVIPTHNRHDKVTATVRGLARQTLAAADYEIIVVDDGSTPPFSLNGQANARDGALSCQVVRLEGVERSAARNAGAAAARGELLVFVDDDMEIPQDFLEAHLQAARRWPGALQIGAIRLPPASLATPFGRFRQALEDRAIPDPGPTAFPNFCAAGNMAIPRERFQELGGFDKNIVSSEDQDLALRHTGSGGYIVFVPEARVVHQDSALDIRSYCRRAEWGMELMIPFCRRYPEMPENQARERINGPTRWGREPLVRSCRKSLKILVANRIAIGGLFFLADRLERWAPGSRTLDRVYRLLLGAHILRGYRKGLRRPHSAQLGRSAEEPTASGKHETSLCGCDGQTQHPATGSRSLPC